MIRIRPSRTDEGQRLVEIWRTAVDATHDFLTREDRLAIDREVQAFLPQTPLWLAVDTDDRAIAFMGLEGSAMEALFVHPDWHGCGVGRALVTHALAISPTLTTAVNEQNDQARRFYRKLGFTRTGRSDLDDHGWPYPLLHLRLTASRFTYAAASSVETAI